MYDDDVDIKAVATSKEEKRKPPQSSDHLDVVQLSDLSNTNENGITFHIKHNHTNEHK